MSERLVALTHPEFQLLELVEEYGIWVKGIADGESWGANNKRRHTYTPAQWATSLHNLSERGFVKFYLDELRGPFPIDARTRRRLTHNLSREQLLAEMRRGDLNFDMLSKVRRRKPALLYQLSKGGAKAWEQFVRPDWHKYLDWGIGDSEAEDNARACKVIVASRERAEWFLESVHHLGMHIVPGTTKWVRIRNWEVRWWKTIPYAHKVTFSATSEDFDWGQVPSSMDSLLYGWRNDRW